MTIYWEFNELNMQELHGNQAYDTDKDFESRSDAKQHINNQLKYATCPNCGGKKLDGNNVRVDIRKVKMYKQHSKKGMFGGEKYVDEHWKTVYRISDIYLKDGGILGGAGHIKCASCKHTIEGRSAFWGQWAANIAEAARRGDFNR